MSKEKQIDEMAKAMCGNGMSNGNCAIDDEPCHLECVYGCCAERLHAKGYRKQSENTIELPCKVGDSIYRVVKGKVKENKIEKIEIDKYTISICFDWHGMGYECCVASQIGKTVFLTKEEAERALKGGAEE